MTICISKSDARLRCRPIFDPDRNVADQKLQAKFRKARFDELTRLVYPDCASSDKLATASKFITWIFHWDDELDCGGLSYDKDASQQFLRCTLDRLAAFQSDSENASNTNSQSCSAAIDAIGEFGCALRGGNVAREARLVNEAIKFAQIKEEAVEAQSAGNLLSIEDYIRLRIPDSAIPLAYFFAEYALDLKIPDEVLEMPEMQIIVHEAGVIGGLANDLLSLAKDVRGEPNTQSIVSILVGKCSSTAQQAVSMTIGLIQASHARFMTAERAIMNVCRRLGVAEEHVKAFVNAGKDLVTGVIKWSYETPRYMQGGVTCPDGSVKFVLGN
jgi:hypothetical protein